ERVEQFDVNHSVGFGVRVLRDGSWGFAASELIVEDEIRRVVALALDNARASRLIQATPIVIEAVPAYRQDWRMPMQTEPVAISVQDKTSKLLAINEIATKAGADFCTSS